ncbi:MAG: GTPase Era [Chloroflexi bacterium]|nr:GTPase Era [Chloroflexota bacterium]
MKDEQQVAGGAEAQPFRAGFVAIVGRANVGKSTLLNQLLGIKLSPVSPRPHTTRHKLLGVLTEEAYQVAFLDTPGYLARSRDWLDSTMVHAAADALEEADLVVLVAEPRPAGDVERRFIEQLRRLGKPAILALNKVDLVRKPRLLPVIQEYSQAHDFREVVPVSALQEDGLDRLLEAVVKHLPEGEPLFPPDTVTDRSERFLVSETIREKVYQLYGQEVPYQVAVGIDEFREGGGEEGRRDYIRATIYVDKESQKGILVGAGGQALKEVGVQARKDIEEMLGRAVYLELWVKTHPRWRKQPHFIQRELEQG